MPKAILEFNLDDKYEKEAHMRAVKADKAYGAIYDILEMFRTIRKYSSESEQYIETSCQLEEKVRSIINESGIDLSEEYN